MKKLFVFASFLFLGSMLYAEAAKEIVLPQPDLSSGKPFMQCVAERRSKRKFSTKALPLQIVGEILYVADGVSSKCRFTPLNLIGLPFT